MPKMMRCLVDHIAVQSARAEYGRRMGAGAIVDFDEVIVPAQNGKPAFTLGHALDGRHDCFEDINVTADGGPVPAGFTHTVVDADTDFSAAVIAPIDAKDQE